MILLEMDKVYSISATPFTFHKQQVYFSNLAFFKNLFIDSPIALNIQRKCCRVSIVIKFHG